MGETGTAGRQVLFIDVGSFLQLGFYLAVVAFLYGLNQAYRAAGMAGKVKISARLLMAIEHLIGDLV